MTILLLLVIIAALIPSILFTPEEARYTIIFTLILVGSLLVIAFLIRPNNYSVSSDKLLIHRMLDDVEIDRNNIKSVQEIDESQVKNSLRTFGVGGFFGSFGKFWNSKLGKMTWYVTRKNNFVLVETKDQKKIILTPDKPEEFVASFKD
jgi:hypothetical protein